MKQNNMANETVTFRPSKKNKNLLSDLNKLAEKENRTLNNYIETILLLHTQSVFHKTCQEDVADKKYTELQLRFFADELIKGIEEKNKQGYGDIKVDYESLILSLNRLR